MDSGAANIDSVGELRVLLEEIKKKQT